jgi:HD superfamily phosphohydrolase
MLLPIWQVYPGATHKRFEHSLGVCSEAFKWADHIYSLQRVRRGVRGNGLRVLRMNANYMATLSMVVQHTMLAAGPSV